MSGPLDIETVGSVRVLHWHDGENRFHGDSMAAWHAALDELEAVDGPLAVVAVGAGKFFSNGLDLDWISAADDASAFMREVHRLLGRMLVFPAYTVAALNGHTFAAGAMLSSAFDHRIMREDRGYWCLPEVDLGLPLTAGMTATVTARLPAPAAADAMLTGRRYDANAALTIGIVDDVAPEVEVLDRAVEAAAVIATKNRSVIAEHKRQLFGAASEICFGST
ncbi:MAG: enoyl-CoA hydratase/isomerase family protein [Acidimicrobiia bacterium]